MTPYTVRLAMPASPLVLHRAGILGYPGPTPRYTHTAYTSHKPLLEPPMQPAYLAYYLSEPWYGLPPLPLLAPQPNEQDLELAYLQGHIASLDRRCLVQHPTPKLPQSQPTSLCSRTASQWVESPNTEAPQLPPPPPPSGGTVR